MPPDSIFTLLGFEINGEQENQFSRFVGEANNYTKCIISKNERLVGAKPALLTKQAKTLENTGSISLFF